MSTEATPHTTQPKTSQWLLPIRIIQFSLRYTKIQIPTISIADVLLPGNPSVPPREHVMARSVGFVHGTQRYWPWICLLRRLFDSYCIVSLEVVDEQWGSVSACWWLTNNTLTSFQQFFYFTINVVMSHRKKFYSQFGRWFFTVFYGSFSPLVIPLILLQK